ncbi:MAG: FHA domain-containing protein [Pyrinomonadaceae bacterium]|nr:FHA domain-containing protein [Pyrinomonadaceae bacterium]
MKIVLAEERGGQERGERAFEKPIICVGRDPSSCDVVFDQVEWPMVSRQHAEFRMQNDKWTLVDKNSKFGTFLNGQRISEPTAIAMGARVQFGPSGPLLRIARVEGTTAEGDVKTNSRTVPQPGAENLSPFATMRDIPIAPSAQTPNQLSRTASVVENKNASPSEQQNSSYPASPASPAMLEYTDDKTGKVERCELKAEATLLGRDAASGVPVDASSAIVSRRHAEIRRVENGFLLLDLGSFNGTLLNDQRITAPTPLFDEDQIQLGTGGPLLRLLDPAHPAPAGAQRAGQRVMTDSGAGQVAPVAPVTDLAGGGASAPASFQSTMVVRSGTGALGQNQRQSDGGSANAAAATQPQLLMQRVFDGHTALNVGRAPDNEIRLDGLQISNHHARFAVANNSITVEDRGSTNGIYVNGERVTGRRAISPQDVVQVGPFLLYADNTRGVTVYDTRSKTRIDAVDIEKVVANRSGGGKIKLLDDVDITIMPNEFVGLLGPSGAGKSTLMDALNGMRPASSGRVFINDLDFYQHLDSLKQGIGYVPQDDIIHRELTVYRTLYYVARLRLSRDASKAEIDQIINEVMDVTGLSERRDVPVAQLSGGQRKRVSIAVELITKPSVIFLDEPTSGLDPATEEKIMRLFRQIAESGRTVVLTTHAMENVRLFDKIVVMMRGRLVFYGTPQEALKHTGAESFKELYDKLEAPIDNQVRQLGALAPDAPTEHKRAYKERREQIAEAVADEWRNRFRATEIYRRNIAEPLSNLKGQGGETALPRRRVSVVDALRQWATLTRRYMAVLARDRFNLLILFGQAPVIALMTYLVVGTNATRDFPFFMLALVAVWFGTSVASREIVKERAVYKRERMVNLGLLPYVGSKLFVLGLIAGLQCILLFAPLKLLHFAGIMNLPGYILGVPQLMVMILTALVGVALGLFVSAVVRTSEVATSLVPLILIPQILFSGLVGVPTGLSKLAGLAMPATWAFDSMKRLAPVDTLREEGSDEGGTNEGRGLYRQVERRNEENIANARRNFENYRRTAETDQQNYKNRMTDYQQGRAASPPTMPELKSAPTVPDAVKVDEDLSGYVDFKHPWMHWALNPIALFFMFLGLVVATISTLRLQDIR